jgi:hypothetical protein
MKTLILLLLPILFPGIVSASEIDLKLINTGIYSGTSTEVYIDKSLPGGTWSTFENPQLLSPTTNVTAKIGVNFGFLYSISSSENKPEIPITVKWSFPGLLLNKDEAPLYNSSLTRNLKSGEVQKAIYGFDVMQELVEGEWIVSVWHAKKLLHTQTFTVKVGKK